MGAEDAGMILLLLQQVDAKQLTDVVTQLNEATKQTSYSIVTGLICLVAIVALVAVFIFQQIRLMSRQADSLDSIGKGMAILLDRRQAEH